MDIFKKAFMKTAGPLSVGRLISKMAPHKQIKAQQVASQMMKLKGAGVSNQRIRQSINKSKLVNQRVDFNGPRRKPF